MKKAVDSKEEILKKLADEWEAIIALGVRQLGLFGSFTRGDQTPESDVDILVEFKPGLKNFDRFMNLCFFLEDLFQRRVELVTLESLSPHLGPHILKEVEYVSTAA